jgi:uncharacterized protein YjbI with pentapeptide repeats
MTNDLTRSDIVKLVASYSNNHHRGYDVTGAIIENENLSRLSLNGFNFTKAILRNTDFTDCKFVSAFGRAVFTEADIEGAKFNTEARKFLEGAINIDKAIFV